VNPDIIGTHGLEKTDTLTLSIKERTGGLPEDWRLSRLRWLGNIFPSNVDKKSHEEEIAVKLCNYVDVYYNDSIDRSIDFMAATATKEEIEKFSLRTGDVIITKDSETPDDIAVPAIVKEVTNGPCLRLSPFSHSCKSRCIRPIYILGTEISSSFLTGAQ
jgi:type I restriction enzyme S subunit